MRKSLFIALIVTLVMSLASCGQQEPPKTPPQQPQAQQDQQPQQVQTDQTKNTADTTQKVQSQQVETKTTTPAPQQSTVTNTPKTTTPQVQKQDVTVYITRTGEKYHRDGCRHLSKSQIPISLSNAKAQGYGPCSVCNPPN